MIIADYASTDRTPQIADRVRRRWGPWRLGIHQRHRLAAPPGTVGAACARGRRGDHRRLGVRAAQQISSWVEQNFEAQSVDDVTRYDLTRGATAGSGAGG